MSSASPAVTYTSVYTDSEPGRVFWGADEEISDGGSLRVIVYEYDGLPMLPVAPPSPDYVPGPEEPQIPPAPQDEDKHEPMFIQPHDPDFPLPHIDSPTAKSPEYVTELDPEEDPEEYKDDETEDGPAEYPMDEGHEADDGDDDDGDSSGDDADDDDEDEDEEEEEEEHLAPTNSTIAIPTATISFPPETKIERLLAMPTPPPSPLSLLSPPSAMARLARCTAPAACPSPPPVPSPLLPSSGCQTQIQALGLAFTQALIDAGTAALPSPPLPPPLHMPPHVDRRDDIPKTEMPPLKRLCLSTLGFRDTWVDPTEIVPEIAPMTVREDSRTRISQRVDVDSQWVDLLMEDRIAHQETIQIVEEEAYAA
nr:hypothetical protein [Tanacetum cinerariifolium]